MTIFNTFFIFNNLKTDRKLHFANEIHAADGLSNGTHGILRTHEEKKSIRREKINFVISLDLIKCVKQIK